MQLCRLSLLFALAAGQEWNESWRPQFHQSTPLGWGNDPNGMVFDGTRYHLFYQHYPNGTTWGPMHWAHSSSKDLLTWEYHGIAIEPVGIRDAGRVWVDIDGTQFEVPEDEHPNVGMAFSGSAYMDTAGKFGQGPNAIILMWTEHTDINVPTEIRPNGKFLRERQSMAYLLPGDGYSTVWYWDASAHGIQNDADSNMEYYDKDTLVPAAKWESDIRDPKLVKYDDNTQLAIIANCDRMVIYKAPLGSTNRWEPASAFGVNNGKIDTEIELSTHTPVCERGGRGEGIWGKVQGGVWECPDLIKMKVEESDEELWVMIVSIGDNGGEDDGPNTGSATMYFVGTLNEKFEFIPVEDFDAYPKWIDYGPDSYAGVTYENTSPPLFQAWMSNWLWANGVPTGPLGWRSGMTLPRELRLVNLGPSGTNPDYRVVHKFVDLTALYDDELKGELITFGGLADSAVISTVGAEVKVEFAGVMLSEEGSYTVKFAANPDPSTPNAPVLDYVEVGLYVDATRRQEFRVIRSSSYDWNEDQSEEDPKPFEHYKNANIARAPRVQTENASLKIHVVFDVASVEVLFDDGEVSMTSLTFPSKPHTQLTIRGTTGIGTGKYAALHSTVYEHTTTTPFPTTTSPTTTTTPPITVPPPATTTPEPTCPVVTCPVVTCPAVSTCSSGASPLLTASSIGLISAVALYLAA